jgi:peroxiredoxin
VTPRQQAQVTVLLIGLLGLAFRDPGAAGGRDLFAALQVTRPEELVEAPDFRLADPEGRHMSLRDHRGKVVLLNFWATWCLPCRAEMPEMEKLYQEFKGQGFVILAVDLRESPAQVRAFAKELKLTFPLLIDEDTKVVQAYAVRALPVTYLIDRKGLMVGRAIGPRDWHSAEARALIRHLLERR